MLNQMLVKPGQSGMVLLESLVAILIFSLGILGMVAINARAVEAATDAQYRTDAAEFVSEIAALISLQVDRSSAASIATSLAAFQHQPGGTSCNFSGTPSTSATVTNWVARVSASGRSGLPGSTTAHQQILVETGASDFNRVTITLCWQGPADLVPRRHDLITYIN